MSGGRSPDVHNRINRSTKNKHNGIETSVLDELDESGLSLEPISKSAFLKRKTKFTERNDRSKTVKRKCIKGNKCNSTIVNKEKILHRKKSSASQNNLEDTVITYEQFQSVLCNLNAKENTVINKTGTDINNSIVNNPQPSLKDTLNYNLKQLACLSQEIKDIQSGKQLPKVPASETSLPNSSKGIVDNVNASIDSNTIVRFSKVCTQISPKRSFSPLPSTSTDNTIFEVNNRNFLYSLENKACSAEDEIVSNECIPKSIHLEGSETNTQVDEGGEQLPANIIETFHNTNTQKDTQNSVITDEAIRSSDNSVCQVLDMITLSDSQNDSVEIVIEDSILSNYNSSQDRVASTGSNCIIVIDDDDGDLPVTGLRQSARLLGTIKKSPNGRTAAPKQNIVETVDLVNISESLVLVPNQMRGCSIVVDSTTLTSSPATSAITTQCSPADNKAYQDSVKKSTPEKTLKSGECVICLEIFGCRPLASTLCGHIFCKDCLDMAMKNSKKCPTCRKTIKKNGFHPIFF